MKGTNARVDARAWRVLGEAMGWYPNTITASMASCAIGDGMPFSAHRALIEDLIGKSLLAHRCLLGVHTLGPMCPLTITERGALARLGREAAMAASA